MINVLTGSEAVAAARADARIVDEAANYVIICDDMAKKRIVKELIARGVPMVQKFGYTNGEKVDLGWLKCTYSKKGAYHYLNNKRVSKTLAIHAQLAGLILIRQIP